MKIRTILGLAAIGGLAYAHKQHGGEFTLDSIKSSLRDLFAGVQDKAKDFADVAKDKLDVAKDKISDAGYTAANDVSDYGRRNDFR